MHAPTETTIPLDDLSLRAQIWGDPHAPPLLALHGWLDNAASFARLAPLLAERFRVIALDLVGHGHSDHLSAGATYHYLGYVRSVLAAAESLQLSRYSLLGHSLGAGIAALAAAAAAQRIERLWLIEGLGPLGDDGSHTLQRFRDALAPHAKNRRPQRQFHSLEEAVDARCRASGIDAELARPIVQRGLIQGPDGWRWRSDPRLTQPSPVRLAETQVHALLRGIAAPTRLLLAQPAAPYLPPASMLARADCISDIRLSHMDGGHHLHLEQPQAVAHWIDESL